MVPFATGRQPRPPGLRVDHQPPAAGL